MASRPLSRLLLFSPALALAVWRPDPALAQAPLAPSNPHQERCIEAFAETQQEKAMRDAIGEPPKHLGSLESFGTWTQQLEAWVTQRAIAVFGSEEAARDADEGVRIDKYTRRFALLRRNAQEDHLPSLYLLAIHPRGGEELRGIPGLPTPEEASAAIRTLHDHHFPLAPRRMAAECGKGLVGASKALGVSAAWNLPPPVDGRIQKYGFDAPADPAAREALEKALQAELAVERESCLDLLREGAFRGDTRAWEYLADYDDTHPPPAERGIVPRVEHYAWLELQKRVWRNREYAHREDRYNVPLRHQEKLAETFEDEQERREALALAQRYVAVLWPRRIVEHDSADVCRLIPQFAGDPDPYGPDPSPR